MGKHEELMIAIHRGDVAAVSKQLAKSSGSKSSMLVVNLLHFMVLSLSVLCGIKPCLPYRYRCFIVHLLHRPTHTWAS